MFERSWSPVSGGKESSSPCSSEETPASCTDVKGLSCVVMQKIKRSVENKKEVKPVIGGCKLEGVGGGLKESTVQTPLPPLHP